MRSTIVAFLASLPLVLAVSSSHAQTPRRILETRQLPSDLPQEVRDESCAGPECPPLENWAGEVCGLKSTYNLGGAPWEWTPVVSGFAEYGSNEPASGWVLNAHESKTDVPFLHPFDKLDFGYLIAVDQPSAVLLSKGNLDDDEERVAARAEAVSRNLTIGSGLLAVEQDRGLVPGTFRPQGGQRVVAFGRWIVDCGHDNWQTEIHPPLLTVSADNDVTTTRARVVSNPHLVSQQFDHGGILEQLLYEAALVNTGFPFIPFNDQVKAEASVLPPSSGLNVFSFDLRAPITAPSDNHRLFVRMHLTARPGVIVQPFLLDEETLSVLVLFTDELTAAEAKGRRRWNVSYDDLITLHKGAGHLWGTIMAQVGFQDWVKAAVFARGIRAVLYDPPQPPDVMNAPGTAGFAAKAPWGQSAVRVDPNQPFPLIGWFELSWQEPPVPIGARVSSLGRAIDLHLDEIRRKGPQPRRDVMAQFRALSAINAAIASPLKDNVSGEWRYRMRGGREQVSSGELRLQASGEHLIGAIELRNKRRDVLTGVVRMVDGSETLILTRFLPDGGEHHLRLVRDGSRFAGAIVETGQSIEIAR